MRPGAVHACCTGRQHAVCMAASRPGAAGRWRGRPFTPTSRRGGRRTTSAAAGRLRPAPMLPTAPPGGTSSRAPPLLAMLSGRLCCLRWECALPCSCTACCHQLLCPFARPAAAPGRLFQLSLCPPHSARRDGPIYPPHTSLKTLHGSCDFGGPLLLVGVNITTDEAGPSPRLPPAHCTSLVCACAVCRHPPCSLPPDWFVGEYLEEGAALAGRGQGPCRLR